MRYLALLFLVGCVSVPGFVRKDAPGRSCFEACDLGEADCVENADIQQGYLLLGPLLLGHGDSLTIREIKACEIYHRVCASRCGAPAKVDPSFSTPKFTE